MTPLQLVGFSGLWILLLALAGILLVLYRQVERLYETDEDEEVLSGLPAGTLAPEIEVITRNGLEYLSLPERGHVLLALVTTECQACLVFLKLLIRQSIDPDHVIVLVSGETTKEMNQLRERLRDVAGFHWLGHPPDATRDYRVSHVPTLYVLRDRRVVVSRVTSTEEKPP